MHRWISCAVGAAALFGIAAPASAVRFSVIGDWGSGSSAQAQIANQQPVYGGVGRY